MIKITNVTFQYRNADEPILKEFSLDIKEGEIVSIIGPTGSGKSTICYLFNGLIPHTISGFFEGSIEVNGLNVLDHTIDQISEIVGYILQEPSFQISSPHVESEIVFGLENFATPKDIMEERLVSVMTELGISHLRHRLTSDLSEGEKQKVILASILAMEPKILVLDECSSMIDSKSKFELIKILKKLNSDYNKTIILVEHDLDFALQLSDRFILINNGRIIVDDSSEPILTNIKLLTENGLTPPTLVALFHYFKENKLEVKDLPISLEQAIQVAKEWLGK
ncbi:MAG: ABC transporter ATP-binding protein [Asgard group archaeon]|nr:ABC transporter ATP-binding protein [Asgard group archaeon]